VQKNRSILQSENNPACPNGGELFWRKFKRTITESGRRGTPDCKNPQKHARFARLMRAFLPHFNLPWRKKAGMRQCEGVMLVCQ
jgi:hypothetical protein